MKFDEVVTFFELFIKFSRQQSSETNTVIGDILDKEALVELANEKFFVKQLSLKPTLF